MERNVRCRVFVLKRPWIISVLELLDGLGYLGDGADGLVPDHLCVGDAGQEGVQGVQEASASPLGLSVHPVDDVEHVDLTQGEVDHEEEAQGDHYRGHQGHRVVCRDVEKSNPATEIEKINQLCCIEIHILSGRVELLNHPKEGEKEEGVWKRV